MDLAELQKRVDRHIQLDLRPHYDAYRAQGGGDIDGFLAFLGAARVIDPALLKELYAMTDVETPSILDPAYRGTLLAAWATTAGIGGSLGSRDPAPATLPSPAAPPASDVRFQSISRLGEGAM